MFIGIHNRGGQKKRPKEKTQSLLPGDNLSELMELLYKICNYT